MTAITGLLTEVDQQLSGAGDTQTQYSTVLKVAKDKFLFNILHALFTMKISQCNSKEMSFLCMQHFFFLFKKVIKQIFTLKTQ